MGVIHCSPLRVLVHPRARPLAATARPLASRGPVRVRVTVSCVPLTPSCERETGNGKRKTESRSTQLATNGGGSSSAGIQDQRRRKYDWASKRQVPRYLMQCNATVGQVQRVLDMARGRSSTGLRDGTGDVAHGERRVASTPMARSLRPWRRIASIMNARAEIFLTSRDALLLRMIERGLP